MESGDNAMALDLNEVNASLQELGVIQELLEDDVNMKIILYLFAYQELSLTKLTELVAKSKPTLSRRMSVLEKNHVVYEVEAKGRSKAYRLNPEFVQSKMIAYLQPNIIDIIDEETRRKLFEYTLSLSINSFTLLREMTDLVIRYTQTFETQKSGIDIGNVQNFFTWLMEYGVTLRMLPLSDKLFPVFMKSLAEFMVGFQKEHMADQEPAELLKGENLFYTIAIPTKKVLPRT